MGRWCQLAPSLSRLRDGLGVRWGGKVVRWRCGGDNCIGCVDAERGWCSGCERACRAKRGPLEFDAVESVAPSVLACTELATLMEESMLEIEHTKEALAEHRADGNAQRKVNAWLVRKAREAVARHLQAVHAMESEPGTLRPSARCSSRRSGRALSRRRRRGGSALHPPQRNAANTE